MDLTFQVPMQYCPLPPSLVTSTTGHCFCFGSVSSFFQELVFHSSPVAYWAPIDLGSSSYTWTSLVAQMVKNPPQCRRLRFNPWVGEIPWRRKWQTHSSILGWEIPRTEEPGRLQCRGSQRVGHGLVTKTTTTPQVSDGVVKLLNEMQGNT